VVGFNNDKTSNLPLLVRVADLESFLELLLGLLAVVATLFLGELLAVILLLLVVVLLLVRVFVGLFSWISMWWCSGSVFIEELLAEAKETERGFLVNLEN